jgi:DNA segregation ATPase FtsK/SpoIIIE, S-DNA-T family
MKNLSSFLKSTIFFLTALLILLSLLSYSPNDLSFVASPQNAKVVNLIGVVGAYVAFGLFFVFGYAAYFFPFALFFSGLSHFGLLRFSGLGKSHGVNVLAFIFFVIFLSTFFGLFPLNAPGAGQTQVFQSAGVIGFFLATFFRKYLGVYGAFITVFLLVAVNAILLFGFFFPDFFKFLATFWSSISEFFSGLKERWDEFRESRQEEAEETPRRRLRKDKPPKEEPRKKMPDTAPEIKVYTPKVDASKAQTAAAGVALAEQMKLKSASKDQTQRKPQDLEDENRPDYDPRTYKIPHPSIIKVPPVQDQSQVKENIEANIKDLETALADFGVEAKVVSVQKGPVVTMYELQPQAGTKIQKISVLADDIALAMKSSSVRIVAPIPGRGTIGIEIPNNVKQLVFLREVLEEKEFAKADSKLTISIGKDVSGNPIVANLADMPHLLIAGATGAGKTVCVNGIISSILFKAKPDEVKFIMVDPKMVELACFAGIPHLIHPIISEAKKAFVALNWAVEEMERRYRILADAGCRNIAAYNKTGKKLPYIVVIVDELADLMIVARESVETAIQRLAQLSRAVGIHLILATQRPSVDVITGVIKANLPSRVSFKVSAKVDSRTILDAMGADKLLGKGDFLFLKPGAVSLIRGQGCFIDDEDIDTLTEFVRAQGKPVYDEKISEVEKKQTSDFGSDELLEEAIKMILQANQASGSLLQRRLRVGYTRAARLLDLMEQEGIVGPFCGSKAREIIVDPQVYMAERGWI